MDRYGTSHPLAPDVVYFGQWCSHDRPHFALREIVHYQRAMSAPASSTDTFSPLCFCFIAVWIRCHRIPLPTCAARPCMKVSSFHSPVLINFRCLLCRQRKVACDRQQPSCGFCLKNNAQCQYVVNQKRPGLRAGFVSQLEQRICRWSTKFYLAPLTCVANLEDRVKSLEADKQGPSVRFL